MASATSFAEPHVLAHAKRRLFPDPDEDRTYAVADTQFAREEWLPGESIDAAVRASAGGSARRSWSNSSSTSDDGAAAGVRELPGRR